VSITEILVLEITKRMYQQIFEPGWEIENEMESEDVRENTIEAPNSGDSSKQNKKRANKAGGRVIFKAGN